MRFLTGEPASEKRDSSAPSPETNGEVGAMPPNIWLALGCLLCCLGVSGSGAVFFGTAAVLLLDAPRFALYARRGANLIPRISEVLGNSSVPFPLTVSGTFNELEEVVLLSSTSTELLETERPVFCRFALLGTPCSDSSILLFFPPLLVLGCGPLVDLETDLDDPFPSLTTLFAGCLFPTLALFPSTILPGFDCKVLEDAMSCGFG